MKFMKKRYEIVGITKNSSYYLKDNKGVAGKRPVPPCQVKLYYDGWDLGKKIDGDDIDHDCVDGEHVHGDHFNDNHVDGDEVLYNILLPINYYIGNSSTKCYSRSYE